MKKIFILSVMAIIILMPLSGAVDVTKSTTSSTETKLLTSGNGYTNITVQEAFNDYLSCLCAGVQIPIDIRRQDEWDTERIETYADEQEPVHWPNLHLGEGLQEFLAEYADDEVILYCRTANRTWTATKLLVDNGFTGTLYHMLGGITAWKEAGYPTAISVHKAYGMLNDPGEIQTPVDVRTENEWNKEHIDTPAPENPVNYPNLHLGVGLTNFMTEYDDKEVVLYCDTDSRSSEAVDVLIDKIALGEFNGYVHNMIGGMNAWKDAGYPTPRARSYSYLASYPVFLRFLEKFPNAFPILRHVLGL
jgi:rhodanese-related sulfurtransferase